MVNPHTGGRYGTTRRVTISSDPTSYDPVFRFHVVAAELDMRRPASAYVRDRGGRLTILVFAAAPYFIARNSGCWLRRPLMSAGLVDVRRSSMGQSAEFR